MFYGSVKPHITFRKRFIEFFNEYMILFISLHMLCFTNFISDNMIVFVIGYQFTAMFGLVFIVNIGNMIFNNILKFKIKQKKKRVQKAYEVRFNTHLEMINKLKEEKEMAYSE